MNPFFQPNWYHALIVDFDGTLFDSHQANFKCWQKVLADFNISLTLSEHENLSSFCSTDYVAKLGVHSPQQQIELARKKDLKMTEFIKELEVFPEVLSFVKTFRFNQVAIASGNSSIFIKKVLEYFSLDQHFKVVIGSEDYQFGKPHPEPFINAAKALNIAPELCLALEDADPGTQSALAANMHCLKITNGQLDKAQLFVR